MRSSNLAALGIFVVVLAGIFFVPNPVKQYMQTGLMQAIAPVLQTGAFIQERLGGLSGGLKSLDRLEAENKRLRRDNEELRATNALLENLQQEVNRLNRALGFQDQSPFRLTPARIISRDNATWWNTCTIDRGARDGLSPDMAVVTEAGLVGKLASVSRDISRILLISDETLRVSVTIEGTPEQGIISGTRVSSNYAPDLRIRFLNKTADVKPGMRVLTAGTGGVFPSGLLVGVVKEFTVEKLEGVANVTPAVDLANIKDIFVIRGGK
jgi:rod shape-determining protein MreC